MPVNFTGSYTQNFDTLATTGTTNATLPSDWVITETGGGAQDNEQYAADNGTSSTGDTYSYGSTGSTDRALGGLQSGTLIPTWGVSFTNTTGNPITRLTVSYTGEQWRLGTAGRTDQLDFQYSLDATSLVTGTWTDVNTLDFVTPVTSTTGAQDGNAAANRTAISTTLTGLNIPNGATFWFRWQDLNASGADDGLAIDDFSLSSPSFTISSLSLIGSGTLADTAVAGVFGDISGIAYNEASNTYQVVSDATNRVFTVQLAIDAVGGSVTPAHLNGTETSTVLGITGGFNAPDLEGITRDRSGNFFVSSEGAYAGGSLFQPDNYTITENPFIKRFNASGTELLTLTLPSRYTTSSTTVGPRNNLALESLTLTPNDSYLFTAVEAPLKQDQSLTALQANAAPLNRILRFDLSGGIVANPPSQEFLYVADAGYGLSELLAIDNSGQRLLAIERAANTSGTVTGVKVYEISLTGATDISGTAALGGSTSGITTATKSVLADFSTPALSSLLANYEGVTFGPLLPDGRRSLVLVSDNNGAGARFTTFALNEAPTLVTIAATDASAAEAGQNPGTFRISRTGGTTNSLTVNYAIATGTGQATSADYTPTLTGSVVIPIGQSFVDITITPADDAIVETGGETVTLNLIDTAIYDLGTTTSATVTIADNDVAVPSLLNGPNGSPDAIGATNTNDDFTNQSSNVPVNLTPGFFFDPNAVTFTNTVRNTGSQTADIALLPTLPANVSDLPVGTIVAIAANNGATTATYTYTGSQFTFTNGTGIVGGNPVSPTNPVRIDSIAPNGTANYTVTIDLPPGTPLSTDANLQRGFPVAITAFIDSNGNGLADDTAANRTINRVYTGFLQLVTQTRILQGSGPAVQGADGTLSTTQKTPAPGNIIESVTEYRNISEGQPTGGSGNGILTASNVVITQDGTQTFQNWARDNTFDGILDTSHLAGSAQGASGILSFFSGNPATTPATNATSGTTPATDVTKYVNTLNTPVAPGASGTFSFQRSVNVTAAGTNLDNIATATYENPNNPNVPINGTANSGAVAIAEVAGISVVAGTVVDDNGGTLQAGDLVYVPFTITNIGNDPTRFQLPTQAGITGPGTPGILQYSTDGGVSWTDIPAGGLTTTSTFINGSVQVRVPVTINAGATPGQTIRVTLGETNPPETNTNAPRVGSINDARDVYTVDTLNGQPGETTGDPVNGVVEGSAATTMTLSPKYYALAHLALTRTAYSDNNTPTNITDDTITYALSLGVRSTDVTGQSITPSALAGIPIPGLSGQNILVSDAIPLGTELAIAPTAPAGWQVVYSTTPVTTPANAATWTTTPLPLSQVTRVGFVKPTIDGNPSTYLPAADAQVTQFSLQLKVQAGQTAPLAIANLAQVFGKTPETNTPVFEESGDSNPSNFDGPPGNMTPPVDTDTNGDGVPNRLPTIVSDGYVNDQADLAQIGTDTNGTNTGVGAGGEANVLAIALITQPDLSSGISTPGPLAVGIPFNYTLDVQNNGNAAANGIVLTFTLPNTVTYNSATILGGGFGTPTLSGNTLTFTGGSIAAGNFAQIQVNVTPTQAGTLGSTTLVADPTNTIAETNEQNNAVTTGTFTVNPAPGVVITQSGGTTTVTEGGATDTYTVVLNSQPTANVTIALTSNNQLTTNPSQLVFTPQNWNIAQSVIVTAVNDAIAEGNHTGTITHTTASTDSFYNNLSAGTVITSITDNDTAGVTIAQSGGTTVVTEGGATDTYTVVLNSQPTANVTINLAPNGQLTTDVTQLVFTSQNWNIAQPVTVTAVNDTTTEGNHTGTITHTATSTDTAYNNLNLGSVTANITDNDNPPTNITLSNAALNENVAANTIVGTLGTVDPDGGSFSYSLVSGTGDTDNGAFQINGTNLEIRNSPNFEAQSSYSVLVRTTDNSGLTFDKPFTITINDQNDAPTLIDTVVNLNAIRPNAGSPSGAVGTLVSQLVGSSTSATGQKNVTDQDAGAKLGIAVTAANTTNGTWFFSTDNGTNWNPLGPVADANARLLAADANTRLYFQANPAFTGQLADAIAFRAWDQTSGSNGATASTTITGGASAFSSAIETASIAVAQPRGSDFNGDGKTDLVWRNRAAGANGVWMMDGTKFVSAIALEAVAADWDIVGMADFSKDGQTDILWRNNVNGALGYWVMDGTTYRSSVSLTAVSTNWEVLGVGDFSSDSSPDLYWRDRNTGNTGFWIMDGNSVRTVVSSKLIDTNWVVGGVGDFNNDGMDDLLWNHRPSGSTGIWLMQDTSISQVVSLDQIEPSWYIASVGDFNQDSRADIVWRNSTTGNAGVWFMNGTNRIGVESITPTIAANSGWDIV